MFTDRLSLVRSLVLGGTGVICLVYAVSALVMDRPDPFWFWVPGLAGVASSLTIALSAMMAGQAKAEQAFDEGYRQDANAAARFGFWIAVAMYPIFGLVQGVDLFGGFGFATIFAAMGTLTGAAYLLSFVYFDLRGRI